MSVASRKREKISLKSEEVLSGLTNIIFVFVLFLVSH